MYELTYLNIEFLKKEVSKSGITFSHLQDDLIDHVCCDIECTMKQGIPFEKAYEMVKQKIGIGRLERIQEETLLLIDKNYRVMKTTMKIFGVISPIILAFGTLFKIEHWNGAGIMLVLGFFLLTFIFLPSAIYVNYKEVSNKSKKWTHIFGFLGSFFLATSFLFKLMHWPGTAIVLIIGIVLVCLVFLPAQLINKLRSGDHKVPKYVYILAFIGFIIHLTGFTFKVQHWPGANLLFFVGSLLLIFIALPVYIYKLYKDETYVAGSFIFLVIVTVWYIFPTTLLALNVSRNIIGNMVETYHTIVRDIQYFETNNKLLVNKAAANPKVTKVISDVDFLLAYIEKIKIEMISISSGRHTAEISDTNHLIDINSLQNYDRIGISAEVLTTEKVNVLKKKYSELRNDLLATDCRKDYTDIINGTIDKEIAPENFNSHMMLISSLNSLSMLQLNILKAENAALYAASNKVLK